MIKRFFFLLGLILFTVVRFSHSSQSPLDVQSSIQEVTVFGQGAQVFRSGNTRLPKGKSELVFSGISPSIDKQSIQLKGIGDFTIMAVIHQQNFLNEQTRRQETEQLESQRREVFQKQEADKRMLKVYRNEEAMLEKNQEISGSDGIKTVDLQEAVDFHRKRLIEVLGKQLELERAIQSADSAVQKINRQLQALNRPKEFSTSEILVTVIADIATHASFELSYFVKDAGWYATYDLRVDDVNSPVDLALKANVFQSSGEDWKEIKLKISNGNPTESGAVPRLLPWHLRFGYLDRNITGMLQGKVAGVNVTGSSTGGAVIGKVLERSTGEPLPGATIIAKGTSIGTTSDIEGNFSLNVPPTTKNILVSFLGYDMQEVPITGGLTTIALEESVGSLQEVVVTGYDGKASQGIPPPAATPATQSSYQPTTFTYEIEIPLTVSNDGKVNTVDISRNNIPANYEYLAIPKLERAAYLTAKITGWQDLNLLDGEVNLFFEGTFLGKSVLDLEKATDTLSISLGRDRGIVVERRRLADYQSRTLLGNSTTDIRNYEIIIRNNKPIPINIVVQDQYPISTSKDIVVEEGNHSGATLDKNSKMLTWKQVIPEKAERKWEFGYSVKYPRGQILVVD